MRFFILLIALISIAVSFASNCDGIKKQAACLSTTDNGETCVFCTSGATGNGCYTPVDAQSLPASIFSCTYASSGVNATEPVEPTLKVEAEGVCDGQKKAGCMTTQENGENCAYCSSGAVGSACYKETDAKALPTSIFSCTYQ